MVPQYEPLSCASDWFEDFIGNLLFLNSLMRVSDSSEPRRSADASLLIIEVLINLSDHEDEKNSSKIYSFAN